ncbi:uncharacterized protein OCT59_000361 [Rhizophagus irregularis]|uniref:F-box domain-containing protein n=2 Tax=Rhizophagus irregularis TaxID=588596 RepID=A0A015ID36_RHIIW|nr:hypothetical protein GLOIN_2v1882645 [Rhizophagus irregularis DAOM 181602=DAOM 197198]EXX51805.1 hypothetical protein RirG_258480 [Rhizophagus irregularis DAOM 197198w]POG62775.1 hypothetical protein GLOIN_2v1882645 [Rhizophagus irregularis DAOM 181602=DAOM 197198]UZN99080.1 hypothetical protein OCT59_000361 [Rhizophagus irregularis]GBC47781.1 hypothetical protein GLOIN_2v1882645 [Rhizophagus irregularis DAOM 181602=DAOM 197198]|eukprot:XP_025169641.1 hypothetical protein GLOIN_2v1882645 [Rhizophagus irregularis DAOM 181602=DAOM 197198]
MTCSKLFSGDLPELIDDIIQYFHYDYKTLHSCILVNRLWCSLAIPLLWENPFSSPTKNYHCIEIYLHYLNDDDKTKLNEYVIHNELFPTNTLFNYPKFIQHLNTYEVYNSIEEWFEAVSYPILKPTKKSVFNYSMKKANLSYSSQLLKFKNLVFRSLFLLFIETEVNLHSFEVISVHSDVDKIIELTLQNPNFIFNIKNFKLASNVMNNNITRLLTLIYSNCNSISSLYFQFPIYEKDHSIIEIVEKSLSQIIKSQVNLRKISFNCNGYSLNHSLLSLKNSNCLNTLNTIVFCYVDFKNIDILSEVFNQLNVLESIHILYCYSLDSKFIQQIINITKPFKLKSLFLNKMDELLEPLIQKSGSYLENLVHNSQPLPQFIIKYCSKIKILSSSLRYIQNNYLEFNLIENIKQNLNYLIIDGTTRYFDSIEDIVDNNIDDCIESSSNILQNLGQILPFKLEYLELRLAINGSDLETFLKNSQNTFIKKLLIKNIKVTDDIILYIKEYIVKKKRVKYLSIIESIKFGRFYSLCYEMKGFELYGIQVLNYFDLSIDLSIHLFDFVQELIKE